MIALYSQDKAEGTASPVQTLTYLALLNSYFGKKVAWDITPSSCAAYVRWRTHEGKPSSLEPPRRGRAVVPATARRELEVLRAALNHTFKSRKLLVPIPVDMPEKSTPRDRWLTRHEAARLLMGALGFQMVQASNVKARKTYWRVWDRRPERVNRHVSRFVLLGLYTGTRHDALLSIGWHQHLQGGYVDLDGGVLYRKAAGVEETKKRKPPVRLADRLLPHLVRWKRRDNGLFVVTWDGSKITKMRRAFGSAVRLAGLDNEVTPHILRHTCATWLMQATGDAWATAGFIGATAELVERTYGHHCPAHQSRAAGAFSRRSGTDLNTGGRR